MEIVVPEQFVGKSLRDMNLREDYELQVIGVRTGGIGQVDYVPDPNRPFDEGDEVVITGPEARLMELTD
jgi:trk system potassium uptake protein TrkA